MSLGFNTEIPRLEDLVKDGHVGGELFAKTVNATRQRKQLKSERERFVHYEILIKWNVTESSNEEYWII